ncbi:uncharacterized protein METZ01_LOCUS497465, partial [marine metagenome]
SPACMPPVRWWAGCSITTTPVAPGCQRAWFSAGFPATAPGKTPRPLRD